MKKEHNARQAATKQAGKKLTLHREAVHRLDPDSLKPAAAGACVTHYCRSGLSCLCSSQ